MSEYFLPSTISAENIFVFLLLLALAVTATWFAARYYVLKKDFDSMVQKMGFEYGKMVEEERRKIQRIPYQVDQIELLINEIKKCYYNEPAAQPKETQDEDPEED